MRILLVCGFLSTSLVGLSQLRNPAIDSLEKKLAASTDPEKSRLLVTLAELYYNDDIRKSLNYGQQALTLSHQLYDADGIYQAQKILRRIHRRLGNFTMAVQYTLSSLPQIEKNKDTVELLDTYMTLGNIYSAMQNYTEAHKALMRALRYAEATDAPVLANTYNFIGRNYGKMKNYDSALFYIKKAQQRETERPEPGYGLSYIYNNLGEVYLELKRYDEATYYYTLALTLSEERQSPFGKTFTYNGLARVYQQTNQYDKAIASAQKSIVIAKENLYRDKAREAYGILYELYEARKDYRTALEYYRQYNLYKDSIFSEDQLQYIENLKINYETEKVQQENELLRKESELKNAKLKQEYTLDWVAALIVAFLLTGSFLLYRINLQRRKVNTLLQKYNQTLEQEVSIRTRDLAQSNMELGQQNSQLEQFSYIIAHNLKAPVARITGLINIIEKYNLPEVEVTQKLKDASRELETIIDDLVEIIRLKKGAKNHSTVNLSERLEKVQVVLRDKIKEVKPLITTSLDQPTCYAIPAYIDSILYNLISNSLKYKSKERPLAIEIKSIQKGDKCIITVQDNGTGFDADKMKDKVFELYQRFHTEIDGKGLGLYLVKTQVEALNGTVVVTSQVDKGTRFTISLPLQADH
ncbi:tetratricopeptide repeat-containing sensor histidine kinase [Oscillatoria amoena NRMC-F 0135]|nr:tetratricopeptide repeat-containing sensor histidine kinase [Oscillatoria amoena NRMC-F 0135]